jgi:heme exporter protein C
MNLAATYLMGIALCAIFFVAPTEREMGVVQKIFYMHVPFALVMLIHFVCAGVCSIVYLIKSNEVWDRWAASFAETGIMCGTVVLLTGPLWARKAWGTWWTFEPRLTLTLLVYLLYLGYVSLRTFGGNDVFTRRLAAGVSALSLPGIYFIRVAVDRWGGNHPPNMTEGGYTDVPGMALAFYVSWAAVLVLALSITMVRARIRRVHLGLDAVWRKIQDADLDLAVEDEA